MDRDVHGGNHQAIAVVGRGGVEALHVNPSSNPGPGGPRGVFRRMPALALLIVGACAAAGAWATPSRGREPVRVEAARREKLAAVKQMFVAARVAYPPREVLLRSFKTEGYLELWAGDGRAPLSLIKSYPICAASGTLGPKRTQGDLQVPEGFYVIDALNPWSDFHLSLHVDYPNAADRARSRGVARLGGAIMVHGNCVTIGCIPIEDEPIEEVYLVVHDTRARGGRTPIHIFPRRLDESSLAELLASDAPDDVKELWRALAVGYAAFERTHRVPHVAIDKQGRYLVSP